MDWYYIGHYGQLGPLTLEQMEELVQGGVVAPDTYVWRTGMADWTHAGGAAELRPFLAASPSYSAPPPPPVGISAPPTIPSQPGYEVSAPPKLSTPVSSYPSPYSGNSFPALRSDRSRVLAGILQLVLPGIGRMYLGYAAYGVLQLVLTFCFLVGYLWSIVDGILILAGTPKLDGYGRVLAE
jgi:hypothetical protein